MSRKAKGKRPVYFNDPENDKLLAVIMAMAGELSVLRERVDTIERLASAKGLITSTEIENYRPDENVAAARDKWRAEYLERILRIVRHELESVEKGESAETYERALELVTS